MAYHLAENVQVRKEIWGLLFYSQTRHRILFVKSLDYLCPFYFDGNWTFDRLMEDITRRTGASKNIIEGNIKKSIDKLVKNGMIIHELC